MLESGDGPVKPPKELQGFLKALAGMEWPEGNVRSMRAMSQAWWDFVPVAEDFARDVRARAADLDRSMDGEYAQAMAEYLTGSAVKALHELIGYAKSLSKTLRTAAADVEKAQVLLWVAAALALIQIIYLLATLIYSWMAPIVMATTALTLRMVIQQLLLKLSTLGLQKMTFEGVKQAMVRIAPFVQRGAIDVGVSAGIGAALLTVVDYTTQRVQMRKGQRDELDKESVWKATVGGAIGGAAAGGVMGGARVIVHSAQTAARDLGKKIPRGMVIGAELSFAGSLVLTMFWSNKVVNEVLDNPEAFWGGFLGALSSFGRPHRPGGSGGGEDMKIDVADLHMPSTGGVEKPGGSGDGGSVSSERPPSYVSYVEEEKAPSYTDKKSGDSGEKAEGDSKRPALSIKPLAETEAGADARSPQSQAPAARGSETQAAPEGQPVVAQPISGSSGKPVGHLFTSQPSTVTAPATGHTSGEVPSGQSSSAGSVPTSTGGPVTGNGQVHTGGEPRAAASTRGEPGSAHAGSGSPAQPAAGTTGGPVTGSAGTGNGQVHTGGEARAAASSGGQPPAAAGSAHTGSGTPGQPAAGPAHPGTGTVASPGAGENGRGPVAAQPAAGQPVAGTTGGPGHPGTGTPAQPGASENGRPPATGQPAANQPAAATAGGPAQPGAPKTGDTGPAEGTTQPATSKTDGTVSAPKADSPAAPGTPKADSAAPAPKPEEAGRVKDQPEAERPVPENGEDGARQPVVVEDKRPVPVSGPPAANQAGRADSAANAPGSQDAARPAPGARQDGSPAQQPVREAQQGGERPARTEAAPAAQPSKGDVPQPARPPGENARPATESVAAQRGLRPSGEPPAVVGTPERQPVGRTGEDKSRADSGVDPAAVLAAQLGTTRPDHAARSFEDGHTAGPVAEFVTTAAWDAVRDSVPATRHWGERREVSTGGKDGISPLRFDVRRSEVAGQWVRELSVPVELVSKKGGVDGNARSAFVRAIEKKLAEINGRYRLPGGDQLHVVLDAWVSEAPPRPGWERDGMRRVPVEVGTKAGGGQLSWRAGDVDAAVGKLLRFIGVEGKSAEPVSLGGAAEGRSIRLDAEDLAAIEDTIRDTAGDAREMPPPADPGRPGVVAGPPGTVLWPKRFTALGTSWSRDRNGWYRADGEGTVPAAGGPVVVPEGARALFDLGGEVRYVVLKNEVYDLVGPDLRWQVVEEGLSVERRAWDGAWSAPRTAAGEVQATKMTKAEAVAVGPVTRADGTQVMLPTKSERVVDSHGGVETVVAYRQLTDAKGKRLPQPVTFVPDGKSGWVEQPVGAAVLEQWLASANKADDAAWYLNDYVERSSPLIPEHRRLTELDAAALAELYQRRDEADSFAAVLESMFREEGVTARWTQVSAAHAFNEGHNNQMAAGEGKSWLFLIHSAVANAMAALDAFMVTTSREALVQKEMPLYKKVLEYLGVDVHRVNSDKPVTELRKGKHTIFYGSEGQAAFYNLKHEGKFPGQESLDKEFRMGVAADEVDEGARDRNKQYIMSKGARDAASPEVAELVKDAHDLLKNTLGSGWLGAADFGRVEGQQGGSARLTEQGRDKLELLLDRPLTEVEVHRLNNAALAEWTYLKGEHYVLNKTEDGILIVDPKNHEVMFDPETNSESRWNNGLAQAIEHSLGLRVRADTKSSSSVTFQELLARKEIVHKVGASGTAKGHGLEFAMAGLSAVVKEIPRYYKDRVEYFKTKWALTEEGMLQMYAEDIAARKDEPQLIVLLKNKQVAMLSEMLTKLGVKHHALNSEWQVAQGNKFEAERDRIIDELKAGGDVLLMNKQGGRGMDPTPALEHKLILRTGWDKDPDVRTQTFTRSGRSGYDGEVHTYRYPGDDLEHSLDPEITADVIQYQDTPRDNTDAPPAAPRSDVEDESVTPQTPETPGTRTDPHLETEHPTIDVTGAWPNAPPTDPGAHVRNLGDEPETRPPAALERRDSLFDEEQDAAEVPADVLDTAQAAFIKELDDWRAAHRGVIVPAAVGIRLNDAFMAAFRAEYLDPASAGQQGWRSWLDQAASGLHDIFDHEIPARPAATLGGEPGTRPPEEPSAAPERPASLDTDATRELADALYTARRAFTDQLDTWRDGHPDTVVPAEKVIGLNDAFMAGFQAAYTAPASAGKQDWRSWLDQAASGLRDIFDDEMPARPADAAPGGAVREWPLIPSDREEARAWVYDDGGLSQGRFGKSPAKDFEPFIVQATKIVSLSHRVPVWVEQPDLEDVEAVRLNSAVKDLIARYLANGWSEPDAQKLSAELAVKLGTSRGMPGNPVPLPGGARIDTVPEVGESSTTGAAHADKGSAKPLPPAPPGRAELVGWRPATNANGQPIGPQTLPEFMREFISRRGIAERISLSDREAGLLDEDVERLLAETPLGQKLPPELLEMVRLEVIQQELDPLSIEHFHPWIKEWLKSIVDELAPTGRYRYSAFGVAAMSGRWVDPWVVMRLRSNARTDWTFRLNGSREVGISARETVWSMLRGFVDAAVQAEPGALPRLLAVRYVAERTPGRVGGTQRSLVKSMAQSQLTAWSAMEGVFSRDPLRQLIKTDVQLLLREHRKRASSVPVSVSVKDLLARTDIRTRAVPTGDPRIDLVHLHVDGQQLPGDLDGLGVYDDANKDSSYKYITLQEASRQLTGVRSDDAVYVEAGGLVARYNCEPVKYTGQNPLMRDLRARHRARYKSAVTIVAAKLHNRGFMPTSADELARQLSDWVGMRRPEGPLSDVLGERAGPGSGWLVPVSAGVSAGVGVIKAGMVLGDLGSQVGQAARWLRHEPGVFGVVVTSHTVPDLETVTKALDAAGWNKRDAVRFFLCYQEGLAELAAGLASSFRGTVFYPEEQVWLGVAGGPATGVGGIEYVDGKPQLKLADNGGGWIEVDRSGNPKPGTYVLKASAKAPPLLGLSRPLHLGPRTGSPGTSVGRPGDDATAEPADAWRADHSGVVVPEPVANRLREDLLADFRAVYTDLGTQALDSRHTWLGQLVGDLREAFGQAFITGQVGVYLTEQANGRSGQNAGTPSEELRGTSGIQWAARQVSPVLPGGARPDEPRKVGESSRAGAASVNADRDGLSEFLDLSGFQETFTALGGVTPAWQVAWENSMRRVAPGSLQGPSAETDAPGGVVMPNVFAVTAEDYEDWTGLPTLGLTPIPSARGEVLDWVREEVARFRGLYGAVNKGAENYRIARRLVFESLGVPEMRENPALDHVGGVGLTSAVIEVVSGYLTGGLSEDRAQELSDEIAMKFWRAPLDVVKFRPAEDGTGPRNLREFLILRGISRRLAAGWGGGTNAEIESLLEKVPRLGQMPLALFEMIARQLELDPVPIPRWVRAWLDNISDLRRTHDEWMYDSLKVEEFSGGAVDAWLVDQLRTVAREKWVGKLTAYGTLLLFDQLQVERMVDGFVNAAAVSSANESLPRVRARLFIAQGEHRLSPELMRELIIREALTKLAEYQLGGTWLSAEELWNRIHIEPVEVSADDTKAGMVQVHVDGQRRPGGLYGPVGPNMPLFDRRSDDLLKTVRADLAQWMRGGTEFGWPTIFRWAHRLVNIFNQEPRTFDGEVPPLHNLHRKRYVALIAWVAWSIASESRRGVFFAHILRRAFYRARDFSIKVGLPRQLGVLGGEPRTSEPLTEPDWQPLPQSWASAPRWLYLESQLAQYERDASPDRHLNPFAEKAEELVSRYHRSQATIPDSFTGSLGRDLIAEAKTVVEGYLDRGLSVDGARELSKGLAKALGTSLGWPLIPSTREGALDWVRQEAERLERIYGAEHKQGTENYQIASRLVSDAVDIPEIEENPVLDSVGGVGFTRAVIDVVSGYLTGGMSEERAQELTDEITRKVRLAPLDVVGFRPADVGAVLPGGLRREAGSGVGGGVVRVGGVVLGWPPIPKDRVGAVKWVEDGGGLSDRGKGRPAEDFMKEAVGIVSLYHRVPVWIEKPKPEQEDAVRLNNAVKVIVARYLAEGLPKERAHKLAEDLSVNLGTSRTLPRQDRDVSGAVPAESAGERGEQVVAGVVPAEVTGWRPAVDGTGSRTLRDRVLAEVGADSVPDGWGRAWVENIVASVKDAGVDGARLGAELRVARAVLTRVDRDDSVFQQARDLVGGFLEDPLPERATAPGAHVRLDYHDYAVDLVASALHTLTGSLDNPAQAVRPLAEAIVERLNLSTLRTRRQEKPAMPSGARLRRGGVGPQASGSGGGAVYPDLPTSEGLALEGADLNALGRARVTWEGHLDGSGGLGAGDRRVVALMVQGFVDALVAQRGKEPLLQGGVFVSSGMPDPTGSLSALVESVVRARLGEYPPGAVGISVDEILRRVRVWAIERPAGDASLGVAQLRVDGQRPVAGLFGPEAFSDPADPLPARRKALARARHGLWLAGLTDSDRVFERARKIVNRRNQPPRSFVESSSWVDRAHLSRYRAAVALVAWELYRHENARQGVLAAERLARGLVGELMWPRESGALGGAPSSSEKPLTREESDFLLAGVPLRVMRWRPNPDAPNAPKTFRDYLNTLPLPEDVSFIRADKQLGRASDLWLRAWVKNMASERDEQGVWRYQAKDIVAHGGKGLLVPSTVSRWVTEARRVAQPSASTGGELRTVVRLGDVVRWRPDPAGSGPKTLRAYLDTLELHLPDGISFDRSEGRRLGSASNEWLRAWVNGLAMEKNEQGEWRYDEDDIVALGGKGLLVRKAVDRWVDEVRETSVPPIQASGGLRTVATMKDVAPWRPNPAYLAGPQTLLEFLNTLTLPDGLSFVRENGQLTRLAGLWVGAWVESMATQKDERGRWRYTAEAIVTLGDERLLAPSTVSRWVTEARKAPSGTGQPKASSGTGQPVSEFGTVATIDDMVRFSGGDGVPGSSRAVLADPAVSNDVPHGGDVDDGFFSTELVDSGSAEIVGEEWLGEMYNMEDYDLEVLDPEWASLIQWGDLEQGGAEVQEGAWGQLVDAAGGAVSMPEPAGEPDTSRVSVADVDVLIGRGYARHPTARLPEGLDERPRELEVESDFVLAGVPLHVMRWRPNPDDPNALKFFSDYLNTLPLPEDVSFARADKQLGRASDLWLRAWVKNMASERDEQGWWRYQAPDIVELGGEGLLVPSTVSCWVTEARRVAQPSASTGGELRTVVRLGDVVRWRPDPAGSAPKTLRAYLDMDTLTLPDGISFERSKGRKLGGASNEWLRAWVNGLAMEKNEQGEWRYDEDDIVALGGKGLLVRKAVDRWVDEARETSVPPIQASGGLRTVATMKDVAPWRPNPAYLAGPQTLLEFLNTLTLPDGLSFGRQNVHLTRLALEWVKAWVKSMATQKDKRGQWRYTVEAIATLGDERLLSPSTVPHWVTEARKASSGTGQTVSEFGTVATIDDMMRWQPDPDDPFGSETLQDHVDTLTLPRGISFDRSGKQRLNNASTAWLRAWVKKLAAEKDGPDWRYDLDDIVALGGEGLLKRPTVETWIRGVRDRVVPAQSPGGKGDPGSPVVLAGPDVSGDVPHRAEVVGEEWLGETYNMEDFGIEVLDPEWASLIQWGDLEQGGAEVQEGASEQLDDVAGGVPPDLRAEWRKHTERARKRSRAVQEETETAEGADRAWDGERVDPEGFAAMDFNANFPDYVGESQTMSWDSTADMVALPDVATHEPDGHRSVDTPGAGESLRVPMPVPVGSSVPGTVRSAGGKAALVEEGPLGRSGPQEWFEVLDREGAGVVLYRVSSWGRIDIPGEPGEANAVPGVGWVKWGHDLVHASSGVVLRGHSGWVGRLAAADLPGAAQGVQGFELSASLEGVFAKPLGGGMVWQIPFYGRVRQAAPSGGLEIGGPGRLAPAVPELTEEELSNLVVEVEGELRRLGMPRIVVTREDVRAAHGQLGPSLWRDLLSVQGAKIAQQWLTGQQSGVLLPGAGQSVEAEWAHPIHVARYLQYDKPMDIEEVELHATEVLARRWGAEVILETQDFYRDDQGRLHATEQSALSASAGDVVREVFGLPELVLWVMPHLPGEARDISLEDGRAVYRMVGEALAGISGALGDLPATALADVLLQEKGWEVTELGRAATIGPSALGAGGASAAIHFNVGVPAETGYLFRQYLQARTSSAWGLHTLAHRDDAVRFADEVTAWYLSWRALGHISDRMDLARSFVGVMDLSAQAVRSHVLSAYIHAAAIFVEPASTDEVKYHAADLIRHEPKDLRRALPAQSQEFLRLFAGKIYRLVVAMVNFRVPDRVARARSQSIIDVEERLQDSNDDTRLYMQAALTDQQDHRDVMRRCFQRMTVLDDFDVVDGIPLAVVEVRAYGASKYLNFTEMAQAQDQIAAAATHAHAVAKRLREPTPDMQADFEKVLQELLAHERGNGPMSHRGPATIVERNTDGLSDRNLIAEGSSVLPGGPRPDEVPQADGSSDVGGVVRESEWDPALGWPPIPSAREGALVWVRQEAVRLESLYEAAHKQGTKNYRIARHLVSQAIAIPQIEENPVLDGVGGAGFTRAVIEVVSGYLTGGLSEDRAQELANEIAIKVWRAPLDFVEFRPADLGVAVPDGLRVEAGSGVGGGVVRAGAGSARAERSRKLEKESDFLLAGVPLRVMRWRPNPDAPNAPKTFRDYLNTLPLPEGISFIRGDMKLSRASDLWLRAWVKNMASERDEQGVWRYQGKDIVAHGGKGLLVPSTVASWVTEARRVALPSASTGGELRTVARLGDVARWRPDPADVSGPKTLREYLDMDTLTLPDGISFDRSEGRRLGSASNEWLRAWVNGLAVEKNEQGGFRYDADEIVALGGEGLLDPYMVWTWVDEVRETSAPPIQASGELRTVATMKDVAPWRPNPAYLAGPQTLLEFLNTLTLPDGLSFVRENGQLTRLAGLWVGAWVESMATQKDERGRWRYTAEAIVTLGDERLLAPSTVSRWVTEARKAPSGTGQPKASSGTGQPVSEFATVATIDDMVRFSGGDGVPGSSRAVLADPAVSDDVPHGGVVDDSFFSTGDVEDVETFHMEDFSFQEMMGTLPKWMRWDLEQGGSEVPEGALAQLDGVAGGGASVQEPTGEPGAPAQAGGAELASEVAGRRVQPVSLDVEMPDAGQQEQGPLSWEMSGIPWDPSSLFMSQAFDSSAESSFPGQDQEWFRGVALDGVRGGERVDPKVFAAMGFNAGFPSYVGGSEDMSWDPPAGTGSLPDVATDEPDGHRSLDAPKTGESSRDGAPQELSE
ncbi:hypothetical protein SD37_10710 [Amycolatopsis orientalis]|uniref:SecA family profile domain-containing protein n=1 Tax=Amycolatopsis orientalis TaxID=31958 RepID=A0A193BV20_AMYOR|nr:hypothetical protein [Amycolatopsis orientalis]ANN16067.1 hypothetical protein SD37_10710 [Amycolatopsis orientalis]